MKEMQHAAERAGNSYTFAAGDIRGEQQGWQS